MRIRWIDFYDLMSYDHSLFWRTRRVRSAGGFFTTIHSMTDVAAARAYLEGRINEADVETGVRVDIAYHVKIYCA